MKKLISLLLVILLFFALATACSPNKKNEGTDTGKPKTSGERIFVSIATGGVGGTYYPLGGAIANIFNDKIAGVEANAQSTGASVENVGLIDKNEAELAFIQNDVAFYAENAVETFDGKEKITSQRGIAVIYPEVIQIIATKSSGIKSVADLKGKKVAVGAVGSGAEVNAKQILKIHGIEYSDLQKADFLSFNESADQLKNRQIDAAFITAAVPTSAVTEVTQTADIVIIPVEKDIIAKMSETWPYYTDVLIPKGVYKGTNEDVSACAVMCMLVVPERLDEDLVYEMTKAIFENIPTIAETHDRGNDISLDTALKGMSIELHPGAIKYFKEQGIME